MIKVQTLSSERAYGIRYDVSVPKPAGVDVRVRIIIVAGEVGIDVYF